MVWYALPNGCLYYHQGNSEQISSCDNKMVPVVGWGLYRNCQLEGEWLCFQSWNSDGLVLLLLTFIKF